LLKLRGEISMARRQASDLEALNEENARLRSASKMYEAAGFELSPLIRENRDQFKEARRRFSEATQQVGRLAQDLNIPIEIATNTSAFYHSYSLVSQYPSYFDAVTDRDRSEAMMKYIALRLANALLDAETNPVGGSTH
jgi:hypothetical protein